MRSASHTITSRSCSRSPLLTKLQASARSALSFENNEWRSSCTIPRAVQKSGAHYWKFHHNPVYFDKSTFSSSRDQDYGACVNRFINDSWHLDILSRKFSVICLISCREFYSNLDIDNQSRGVKCGQKRSICSQRDHSHIIAEDFSWNEGL